MLESQRIALRQSEIRQRLNALNAEATLSDEQQAEMDTLTREYAQTEVRYRAAIVTEQADPDAANDGTVDANADPQQREIRRLQDGAQLRNFLMEAAGLGHVTGIDREYRSALFGADLETWIPIALLEPRAAGREVRAANDTASAAPTDVAQNQQPIGRRVFARSIAAYLGVDMPSVPTGDSAFPYLSAGTTAAQQAAGGRQDATAATFTVETLAPRRLTARYLFGVEDAARLPGMEDSLREDLRGAIEDQQDNQVLNGDGTAPNVPGFFHELTDPTAPTTGTDQVASKLVENALSAIDGLWAETEGDLRHLIGVETYRHLGNERWSNTAIAALSQIPGVRASSRVPDPASNVQQSVVFRAGQPDIQACVAPIWDGFQVIRDPYTDANSGQVALTAVMLWNFKVIREAAYAQLAWALA